MFENTGITISMSMLTENNNNNYYRFTATIGTEHATTYMMGFYNPYKNNKIKRLFYILYKCSTYFVTQDRGFIWLN